MIDVKDKDKVILQKIRDLKRGQFKTTGIKFELEAHFNRPRSGGCGLCDRGRVYCTHCDGEWSDDQDCTVCDGHGNVVNPAFGGTGSSEPARIDCANCEGRGEFDECQFCQCEGTVPCANCDVTNPPRWWDEGFCHDWLMEKLSRMGLARLRTDGSPRRLSHSQTTMWEPVAPLMYAEFYRDGSVDSEFTFTLSVANEDSVFLVPKIIDLWKELGVAIGNGMLVERAGLHTALINDPSCNYPSCNYPSQTSSADEIRFKNFAKSMSLLLPALFLGSSNESSRELRFRQPRVASRFTNYSENKYSAVYYNGGAIEFRLFNTCYDNPEAILDNLVVMANCMRYWTTNYRPSGLQKITTRCQFGNNLNDKLDRFYGSTQHIDLLNHGLRKLKPAYYTIRQLKMQRNFGLNKRQLKKLEMTRRQLAEMEYKEYELRFGWEMLVRRNRLRADFIESHLYNANQPSQINEQELLAEIDRNVEERMLGRTVTSLADWTAHRLAEIEQQTIGQYELTA